MKKLTLALFLTLSSLTFAQIAPPKQKIDLHLNMLKPYDSRGKDINIGPPMMLGGAAFLAAGLLTPPLMVGGSTTQKQPFFKQGARAAAIITGPVVFLVGASFTLGGR